MQTIIDNFNETLTSEDLFSAWQEELHLRGKIRTASPTGEGVKINHAAEFDFIKRALYYGNKSTVFFKIIYHNIHNLPILNCVRESSSAFKAEFFYYLVDFIPDHKPQPQDLSFLINIYEEALTAPFAEIISIMDKELCSYLLPRTTNKSLRKLIKARQTELAGQSGPPAPSRSPSNPIDKYPTIYGDKIQIIAKAIKHLKSDHLNSAQLLESAEMLYRAGLLTDCLAIMTEIVKYQPNSDTSSLCHEEPYRQQINQLLRQVLPIYALLVNPGEPHRYVLDIYRSIFLGFTPDPASLYYLDLYTIIVANLQGYRAYARYELAQQAARIQSYRPDDVIAQLLQSPGEKVSDPDINKCVAAMVQRTATLPHESIVIMELLGLWQQETRINLDREAATALLKQYQHFFHWIPGSFFINESRLQQLGPWTDESTRNAGRLIMAAIQETAPEKISLPDNPQRNINFQGPNNIRMELLLGQFMGVL